MPKRRRGALAGRQRAFSRHAHWWAHSSRGRFDFAYHSGSRIHKPIHTHGVGNPRPADEAHHANMAAAALQGQP